MSQVLSELEHELLEAFFKLEGAREFTLTGGAALAEFYFQHRVSNDLDLFTLDERAFQEIGARLIDLAKSTHAEEKPIRSLLTLNQVVYQRGEQEVKLDIVRDSGPHFGEVQRFGNIQVDSLENIGANKVAALFGRAAYRDYIDLYFILREGKFTFSYLLGLAKQKDTGIQDFYLAGWLKQQTPNLHTPPTLLKTLDLDEVKRYFLKLADEMMAGLDPEEKLRK